jgi:hypothetical protein
MFACEKEVHLNISEAKEEVVVYSFIFPDSIFRMHLSESVIITSSSNYKQIKGASIQIRKNGMEVLNSFFPDDTVMEDWPGLVFDYGDTVDVAVAVPHKDTVSSRTVIPKIVPFMVADTVTEIRKLGENSFQPYFKVHIRFDDSRSVDDYYQLVVARHSLTKGGKHRVKSVTILKEDPVFLFMESGGLSNWFDFKGLFSDVLINGQSYTLNFAFDKEEFRLADDEQSGQLVVYLYHHTYDYYEYLRTNVISKGIDLFPSFEPVKIHSNVNRGVGLFSGMAFHSVGFDLTKGL